MKFIQETSRSQKSIFGYAVDDFISKDHFARMVNELFDMIDMSSIEDKYSELGRPGYYPKSMLKAWFYAYANGIRSSRKLAKLLEENVSYMYLTNLKRPRYRALCYFRKDNKDVIVKLFAEVVHILYKLGFISYNKVFIDGTLMKANASKRRSRKKDKVEKEIKDLEGRIKQELKRYFCEVDEQDEREDEIYGDRRGDELPPELASEMEKGTLRELVEKAKSEIEQEKAKILDKSMEKLEENRKVLKEMEEKGVDEINLTDEDTKLMKHNRGDKAKPAYNGQLASENQFITGCFVSQDKSDDHLLIPAIEKVEEIKGESLENGTPVTSDAGYYNHDNLIGLSKKNLNGFIPEKARNEGKPFSKCKFRYIKEEDIFLCPAGEKLYFSREREDKRRGKTYRIYYKRDCRGCKYFRECASKKGREIWEDGTLGLVEATRKRVESEYGKLLMEKRKIEVEPVFGNIKYNMGYRHFLLRGNRGAEIEWTMMCTAHNLKKLWIVLLQMADSLKISMEALIKVLIDRSNEIIPINLLLKTLSVNIRNFKEQFYRLLAKFVFCWSRYFA